MGQALDKATVDRKLTAVFYTDIAGYSKLTRQDEVGTHREAMATLDFVSEKIANGGGKVLRYAGDAILAEFQSAVASTSVACDIQNELASRNRDRSEDAVIRIRIGLNLGEVIQDRDEIFGDGVNLAARLEAAADPGGVCISSYLYEQIRGKVSYEFHDEGEETFKNIDRPIHIYRWHPDKASSERPSSESLELPDKPSIAVLPFDNMSNDPEQEYFADGITEDIITELSREKDIFVIARNSTFVYKGRNKDVRDIARELGVRFVLEGSVRKSGDRIRLNAQLIEGETNRHVWSERYDRLLEDIFEVQDDLTSTIMNALYRKITDSEIERALRRPPKNMAAYDHYLRGYGYMLKLNKDGIEHNKEEGRKAIELDPEWPRGYVMLGWGHLYSFFSGWAEDPAAELEQSFVLAQKAIECDKDDFWGYALLAFAELFRRNHERALTAVDRAIVLNPNSADNRAMRASILNHTGQPEAGLEEMALAIRHNPNHPAWYFVALGRALFMLERYNEALPYIEKLVEVGDDIFSWRSLLAACYEAVGRHEDAVKEADELAEEGLTIETVLEILPSSDQEMVARYTALLRDAGLPE